MDGRTRRQSCEHKPGDAITPNSQVHGAREVNGGGKTEIVHTDY